MDQLTEALSEKLHDIYQQEAHRQNDVRHPEAYAEMREPIKEYDRVLARFILKHADTTTIAAMLADPLDCAEGHADA